MYAIMGITGRVGGAIAENLLAQGEQIRAIARNPEKAARWRERGPGLGRGRAANRRAAPD